MSQETIEASIIKCDSCREEFEMNNRTAIFQEDDSFAEENAILRGWVVTEDADHFCPKCTKEMLESGEMYPNPELEGEELIFRPLTLPALDLIAAERERHESVEGWTKESDQQHTKGELAIAAAAYALPDSEILDNGIWFSDRDELWPINWDPKMWKPSPDNRIKELVKAGALIASEIDRLQHLKLMAVTHPQNANQTGK